MGETHLQQLERRNRELSILNEIARALNAEVDISSALHTVLGLVSDLLDLNTSWIWLLREETEEPYLAAARNLPPALANHPRRMDGFCYCLDTYRDGDLDGAANVNVVKCSRLSGLLDGTLGLLYHSSIPLYAHGKRLGVLNVASPDWRELSEEDLKLLYTIGDLLSIAVERARLFARQGQMAAVEERNRLAREIHDTLAQGLAGIAMHLETVDALLEAEDDSGKVADTVTHALHLTRSSLVEARRSMLDLRAAPLEGRTLAQAIGELVKEIEGHTEIDVRYKVVGAHVPLPVRVESGMYRIAQEALNNVQKHADANSLFIRLQAKTSQVVFTVEDDGRGFDPTDIPKGHYGLIGLRERVHILEGTLDIKTTPGEGTYLQILIPL